GDDECRDLFAPAFGGETGHRHLGDGRMLLEHHLYLARVDVVSAGDDQLFDPSSDGEASIGGDLADVAGAKPAVDEDVGRRRGIAPVALEDLAALQLNFILFAEPHLHARQGIADPAGLTRPVIGVGDDDPAFRDPIAFEYRLPQHAFAA